MGIKISALQNSQELDKKKTLSNLLNKEITLWSTSFSATKKERFYTELGVLLSAGFPLKESLSLLVEEQSKKADKELLENVLQELVIGKNFSDALSHQKAFSAYEVHCLRIGERTGQLAVICKDLGAFFEQKNKQKRAVVGALSYPIIVLITAFAAIVFMLQFVVPLFEGIFKQNKTPLPWITRQIIGASEWFERYFLVALALGFLLVILSLIYKNHLWYRKTKTALVLRIPFVGPFIRNMYLAQFTQALYLLTQAKIPLLNSIELIRKMIPFYPLQKALQTVYDDVLIGKPFYESIREHKLFDKKMSALLKVAEETNQTEAIFKRLHTQYSQALAYQSKVLGATIEPILIVVLGLIVAIILIGMYLPMFTLSTVLS